MDLEWDEVKRNWTRDNRQMDFADVARIDLTTMVTRQDRRQDYGELRYSSFAYLDGTLINFCWTPRQGRIRIISMRKANDRERKAYLAQ